MKNPLPAALMVALAVAAVAPARAEKPWPAPRKVVPSDSVCRSRPVGGCMDAVVSYLRDTARQLEAQHAVEQVVQGNPQHAAELVQQLAVARQNLAEQARQMRDVATQGEVIPLREELTRQIVRIYNSSMIHHRVLSQALEEHADVVHQHAVEQALEAIASHHGSIEGHEQAFQLLEGSR